ncbi:hypothetical protein [Burkholderia diffusa]|uniref:hypothetical protein n=1 Tax=Burkholderia diffusa TaxID=488732 RepID=UPI0008421A62|nr:hypothetical protein [Burkholderia diffusa]AOI58107.1 hypothetical protein WI26_11115 [Burkholderia diffusa]
MITEAAHLTWVIALFATPVIILLVPPYLLAAALFALSGTRQNRQRRIRRAVKHASFVVAATAGIGYLGYNVWLAELRQTAHACTSQMSSDRRYVVTQCLLNAGYDVLRVYDDHTKRMLAERTYACEPSNITMVIAEGRTFDGCAAEKSNITLPPSILDQVRARLP